MHAPTRRALHRAQRTEHILETALELLVEEGLEALTVHRVARQLDVTAGALYRYFPSKDALLAELQVRFIAEIQLAFEDHWSRLAEPLAELPPGAAALARIFAAARTWLELHDRHPARTRLLAQVLAEPDPLVTDPTTFGVVMAPALQLLQSVAARFDDATRHGALAAGPESPLRRAVVLWGALQGTAQLHKLARLGEPAFARDTLEQDLVAALLRGWGATPAALQQALRALDTSEPTPPPPDRARVTSLRPRANTSSTPTREPRT